MPKSKTSKKRAFCFEDMQEIKIKKNAPILKMHKPLKSLKNTDKVGTALLECLIANDTEAFIEILESYLRVNRSSVARKTHLSRSTVQQALSKTGNPTLRTLAKIVHEAAAA